MEKSPCLAVVMPAFNEEASLVKVVSEWFEELTYWTEDFRFLLIDDGSRDGTMQRIAHLQEKYDDRLIVHSRENRGHGQTCREGYLMAEQMRADWILQLDSDGQCDPQYFYRFWRLREQYDVIFGVRKRRDDGWRRVIASLVLKSTLFAIERTICPDANVPYRLMKTEKILAHVQRIPEDFFLVNVALSVLIQKDHSLKIGCVPIRFRERYGGEPSVKMGSFAEKALELRRQLRSIPR